MFGGPFPIRLFRLFVCLLEEFGLRTLLELGQLTLMTSSVSSHLLHVALSTAVDLPIVAGSREMTSSRTTVKQSPVFSPENLSSFPCCTTLSSFGMFGLQIRLMFFEVSVSRMPFPSNERQ